MPLPDDVPFFTAGAPPVAGSWEPIPASPALPQVDRRSRGLIVCAAVLGVVVVVAIGWFGLHRHGSVRVGPVNTEPVLLPPTVSGYGRAPVSMDFARDTGPQGWRAQVTKTLHGNTVDGAAYGRSLRSDPLINVVVARTDLTDKLDVALAAPPYTTFGPVTCSQTVDFTAAARKRGAHVDPSLKGPPVHKDRWAICWQTSDRLSVSAFALLLPAGQLPMVARSVSEVWNLQ